MSARHSCRPGYWCFLFGRLDGLFFGFLLSVLCPWAGCGQLRAVWPRMPQSRQAWRMPSVHLSSSQKKESWLRGSDPGVAGVGGATVAALRSSGPSSPSLACCGSRIGPSRPGHRLGPLEDRLPQKQKRSESMSEHQIRLGGNQQLRLKELAVRNAFPTTPRLTHS